MVDGSLRIYRLHEKDSDFNNDTFLTYHRLRDNAQINSEEIDEPVQAKHTIFPRTMLHNINTGTVNANRCIM